MATVTSVQLPGYLNRNVAWNMSVSPAVWTQYSV